MAPLLSIDPRATPAVQGGSALISSLMILILIMIIGATSMSISDIQFKLSGNLQFASTAMSHSETSVVEAENWLAGSTAGVPNYLDGGFTTYSNLTPHRYPPGYLASLAAPANDVLTMTWDDTNSREAATSASGTQRYIVELLERNVKLIGDSVAVGGRASSGCAQVTNFKVTARGVSARGATKFIQTNYSVLSC